jgi:WD40-like Beta Propeller Repeat
MDTRRNRDRRWEKQRILAGGAIAVTCVLGVVAVTRAVAGGEPTATPSPSVAAPSAQSASDGAREQSDGWIAYSTAPANDQPTALKPSPPLRGRFPDARYLQGSDVYLVRPGGEPRLLAGRGDGTTWNVCPAFSPDRTMLAFGTRSPKLRAIRVVGVTREGAVVAPRLRLPVEGRGGAPCPGWSVDGSRVAYRVGRQVVVRALDGSFPHGRAGDPTVADFRREEHVLVSPTGDRAARFFGGAVTVAQIDGSEPRGLHVGCLGGTYALAGWSPDGRNVLVMCDINGFAFTMFAVPVDPPGESVPVVAAVRVNDPRSWPGHGDVSWQPTGRVGAR